MFEAVLCRLMVFCFFSVHTTVICLLLRNEVPSLLCSICGVGSQEGGRGCTFIDAVYILRSPAGAPRHIHWKRGCSKPRFHPV